MVISLQILQGNFQINPWTLCYQYVFKLFKTLAGLTLRSSFVFSEDSVEKRWLEGYAVTFLLIPVCLKCLHQGSLHAASFPAP